MLYYALVFFVVAIIAGVLGFGGIAGASAGIAQILFFLFLAFLAVSVIMHLVRGRQALIPHKRPQKAFVTKITNAFFVANRHIKSLEMKQF